MDLWCCCLYRVIIKKYGIIFRHDTKIMLNYLRSKGKNSKMSKEMNF